MKLVDISGTKRRTLKAEHVTNSKNKSIRDLYRGICDIKKSYQSGSNTVNLLKPNDIYICRTAALTSRRYILNIYSTNIHTEYFKHAA